MIGARRTTAPMLLIAAGAVALIVRQSQVQIDEHEIWSEEAARLERSGELLPYTRGSIRDAVDRTLVEDREAYHVTFSYRDFRRGHPVGIVTHAASVVLLEPVSLVTTLEFTEDWASALVQLTPGDLYRMRQGQGLQLPLVGLPKSMTPEGEARTLALAADDQQRAAMDLAGRAGDLGFYIGRLLRLTKQETKDLLRAHEDQNRVEKSYLQLVAELRKKSRMRDRKSDVTDDPSETNVQVELRELREFVTSSLLDLDTLAARMGHIADPGNRPCIKLVTDLEIWRRSIENAAARKLFDEAAHFTPGRLEADILLDNFELDWIALFMRWDRARLETWAKNTRASWLGGWRGSYALPRLLAELRQSPQQAPTVERACSLFSTMWYQDADLSQALDGAPAPLDQRAGLAVFGDLRTIFMAEVPGALRPGDERLPWAEFAQRTEPASEPAAARSKSFDGGRMVAARGTAPEGSQSWLDVEARLTEAARAGKATTRAARWTHHLDPKLADYRSRDILLELASEVCDSWEASFQQLVGEALVDARASADPTELTATGGLRFNEDSLDRAADRARFILRDYGMRENRLLEPGDVLESGNWPAYEVVQLLTRYPDRFPGFHVQDARERVALVRTGEATLPGVGLLGSTVMLDAARAHRQRSEVKRLAELRAKGKPTEAEKVELCELIAMVETANETRGASGIEGSFNRYLRGLNGYRERVGLQEAGADKKAEATNLRNVIHGQDLGLTLHNELQFVAEEVLEFPDIPGPANRIDQDWLADPEGAIVIMRPNGDLVVAASGPAPWSPRVSELRPSVERCLTMVDFKPPGSTFKPFAALWALEQGKLSLDDSFLCHPDPTEVGNRMGGYKGVHCHSGFGHQDKGFGKDVPIDLYSAIHVSCNVFFAHVGESLTTWDFQGLADAFGFGEATGIAPEGTSGIVEHSFPALFDRDSKGGRDRMGLKDRMRAANGLSVVQATPVQLARATAGLATGSLPSVRIVDRIGAMGEERQLFGPEPEPLPFSKKNLDIIREAMAGVASLPSGSGNHALAFKDLGFAVAMKTGSADLTAGDSKVRKHTWVMGWAPAEDPKAVFVFFVRDTMATSHYSSTYLARQFLVRPEFREWLHAEGADLDLDFVPGPPIPD
jgi:cell division protein FtsI/penicillin-binding protein 2